MWRGLPGAAAEDKVVGSKRAPRHVRRPAEGEGGPASEAVKQMATEMHRRWPRFTHAPSPPLSLHPLLSSSLPPSSLSLHSLLSSSLPFFLPQYVRISLITSANIRFFLVGHLYFYIFFLCSSSSSFFFIPVS